MGVRFRTQRRLRRPAAIGLAAACAAAVGGGALQVPGAAAQEVPEPDVPPLSVDVDDRLVVGRLANVSASGIAPETLAVWIFADPLGRPCPAAATARPLEAITVVSGLPVGGAFSVSDRYRPLSDGTQTFCAYLGKGEETPAAVGAAIGTVELPMLAARVARQTIRVALRRHGFAKRVIDAVDQRCRRRNRVSFACRFEAAFRGYSLEGRGKIEATAEGVSYRFRVEAQGARFVLTDDNERGGSG
jgi:hypothetical protein